MKRKQCTQCKKKKALTRFHLHENGRHSQCSDCRNAQGRARYKKNAAEKIRKVQEYRKQQPIKYRARSAVSSAIERGILIPQLCEHQDCKETKTEAHHDDYTQPLEVRWLCRRHHRAIHLKSKL